MKNNKQPKLPPAPATQGCGCGGGSNQRKKAIRKVINRRRKKQLGKG